MNYSLISHGYANDLDLWFPKITINGGKMPAGVQNTFRAMIRCAVGKDHAFCEHGYISQPDKCMLSDH